MGKVILRVLIVLGIIAGACILGFLDWWTLMIFTQSNDGHIVWWNFQSGWSVWKQIGLSIPWILFFQFLLIPPIAACAAVVGIVYGLIWCVILAWDFITEPMLDAKIVKRQKANIDPDYVEAMFEVDRFLGNEVQIGKKVTGSMVSSIK